MQRGGQGSEPLTGGWLSGACVLMDWSQGDDCFLCDVPVKCFLCGAKENHSNIFQGRWGPLLWGMDGLQNGCFSLSLLALCPHVGQGLGFVCAREGLGLWDAR